MLPGFAGAYIGNGGACNMKGKRQWLYLSALASQITNDLNLVLRQLARGMCLPFFESSRTSYRPKIVPKDKPGFSWGKFSSATATAQFHEIPPKLECNTGVALVSS